MIRIVYDSNIPPLFMLRFWIFQLFCHQMAALWKYSIFFSSKAAVENKKVISIWWPMRWAEEDSKIIENVWLTKTNQNEAYSKLKFLPMISNWFGLAHISMRLSVWNKRTGHNHLFEVWPELRFWKFLICLLRQNRQDLMPISNILASMFRNFHYWKQ